jgi:hypothetical protein
MAGSTLSRAAASPRVTFAGFAFLAVAVAANLVVPNPVAWSVAGALVTLAINLAASLHQVPRLRRGGLGVFHFSLLACLLLLAIGRLMHFDGRMAIVDGQQFDPRAVETTSRGPWHGDTYRELRFEQGWFSVAYAPGVRRERTTSMIAVPGGAEPWQAVGDDTPLKLDGYRFYTTHNKGFAPVLTWSSRGQAPVTGAVMLPSYPMNDWQQVHRWESPGGPEWRFWLRVPAVDETGPWSLEPRRTNAVLIAEAGGHRFELHPGEEARTQAGTLRYEWLAGWMGYRIFYDPTLIPLLLLAVLGVMGLAQHLWAAPRALVAPSVTSLEARLRPSQNSNAADGL